MIFPTEKKKILKMYKLAEMQITKHFLTSIFLRKFHWIQGRHGRFLEGKDAIVAATSLAAAISQNPAKSQALAALPLVAVLEFLIHYRDQPYIK